VNVADFLDKSGKKQVMWDGRGMEGLERLSRFLSANPVATVTRTFRELPEEQDVVKVGFSFTDVDLSVVNNGVCWNAPVILSVGHSCSKVHLYGMNIFVSASDLLKKDFREMWIDPYMKLVSTVDRLESHMYPAHVLDWQDKNMLDAYLQQVLLHRTISTCIRPKVSYSEVNQKYLHYLMARLLDDSKKQSLDANVFEFIKRLAELTGQFYVEHDHVLYVLNKDITILVSMVGNVVRCDRVYEDHDVYKRYILGRELIGI